jgi:nicotinate phosphoribosyltransferase
MSQSQQKSTVGAASLAGLQHDSSIPHAALQNDTATMNLATTTGLAYSDLSVSSQDYSLITDLYQLTMTACYVGEELDQRPASFELFARRLPHGFGYLVAMGLEQALDFLANFHFTTAQIEGLQATGVFSHAPDRFWSLLTEARFTGDVWAVPEGTVIFANEPLLRVEAPLWQAQVIETFLLNVLNYQTLIATRAARMRDVAGREATLLEFGTRRAFSPQASLWAARAALAAGMNATSNVLASLKFGYQPSGTMAHSLVMALSAIAGSEMEAFTAYHRYFPGAPLLIDTYDPIVAAHQLAERIQSEKMELAGVRIDSGDFVALSQQVHELLPDVPIFASGDIDEHKIAELRDAGAPIHGYGLGTKLVTGEPVNGVYKLVEIDGIPVMKESAGKATYPGRKQIFRHFEQGQLIKDSLGLMSEAKAPSHPSSPIPHPSSTCSFPQPLLQLVMKEGKRLYATEPLPTIAQRTSQAIATLPPPTRQLKHPIPISVELSPALTTLIHQTQHPHTS